MYDPQRPVPPGRPYVPPRGPVPPYPSSPWSSAPGPRPVAPPPGFPPPGASWGPVPPQGPPPMYGPPRPPSARRWPWVALVVALSVGVGVLGAQLYAAGTLASAVGPTLGGLVGEAPSSGGSGGSGSSGGSAATAPDVNVGVTNSASSSSAAGSSSSATGGSATRSGRSHPLAPRCSTPRCQQGGGGGTHQPPLRPRIQLTLRCDLMDVAVCRGRGYTVPYDSVVTDGAGRPISDRCFDHASVTNAKGVEIWKDSFACNSANPISIANNKVLPDGEYTIHERVDLQDGGSATETLTFTVRS